MIRLFHSSSRCHVRVKESLGSLVKSNLIKPPLTKKQIADREAKTRRYESDKRLSPFSPATAKKIIESKFDIEIDNFGPETHFTESQLQTLFQDPKKRLIFNVLGTSGKQLQDADTVNQDVRKFLKRDELSKAIYMCKLARKKGVVAMNEVMKYLLERRDVEQAFSLFQYRKKWGIEPNAHTYSILFTGIANQPNPASSKTVAAIMKIVEALKEKDKLDIIHLRTALLAIFNSVEPIKAIELYKNLDKKHRRDTKATTIYLNGLGALNEKASYIIEKADSCFERQLEILSRKDFDAQLIVAYSSCYSKRKNLKYVSKSITILRSWFNLCEAEKINQVVRYHEPRNYRYQELEPAVSTLVDSKEINPFNERLPINNQVLDIYISLLQRLGKFKAAVIEFDALSKLVTVDTSLFNKYLSAATKLELFLTDKSAFSKNAFYMALMKMHSVGVKPNSETNIIIYNFLINKIDRAMTSETDDSSKGEDAGYFLEFLMGVKASLLDSQARDLTFAQSSDFLKCLIKLQPYLAYNDQAKFLYYAYFDALEVPKLSNPGADYRKVDRIVSLNITALTVLKNMAIALGEDRDELTWSSLNRIKNALQVYVNYLRRKEEVEDPGYERLKEIEEEKDASIKSYRTLILRRGEK